MNSDSASTSDRIAPSENPSVFSTASSLVRSRTDCAIVLAATSPNMNSTVDEIAIMIAPMSPIWLAKPSTKPFSVVVLVSAEELANISSNLRLNVDGLRRIGDLDDVPADQTLSAGVRFSIEVVVAEEELRLVDAVARRRRCRRC